MRSKPISYTTNLWILPLLMAIISVSLQAQKPGKDSWGNLNRLQAGQKIQVVQMDMKSLKGRFLGFSEEAISLKVKKKQVSVPRTEILRVSASDKAKRNRNGLIGLAIGVAGGLAVGIPVDKRLRNEGQKTPVTAILAPAGAAVGYFAGRAGGYQTIYRVKRIKRGKGR